MAFPSSPAHNAPVLPLLAASPAPSFAGHAAAPALPRQRRGSLEKTAFGPFPLFQMKPFLTVFEGHGEAGIPPAPGWDGQCQPAEAAVGWGRAGAEPGGTPDRSLLLCTGVRDTGLGTKGAQLNSSLPAAALGHGFASDSPVAGSAPAERDTWRELWLPPTRRSPWRPRSSAPGSSGSRG